MKKKELVDGLAAVLGFTKKDTNKTLIEVFNFIGASLADGEEVSLPGFGKFKLFDKKAYTARNPQTGDPIDVPAKRVVKFKAAKALKDAVA